MYLGRVCSEFKRDVLDKLNAQVIVDELFRLSGGKSVVLMCYEKDRNTCHRSLVGNWIEEKLGIEVKEFRL